MLYKVTLMHIQHGTKRVFVLDAPTSFASIRGAWSSLEEEIRVKNLPEGREVWSLFSVVEDETRDTLPQDN